jgi:uncharacterized protein YoaH (UPF0181 family)
MLVVIHPTFIIMGVLLPSEERKTMSDLAEADITTGTELVYQGPSVDFTNDRDYRPAVRGTVVDIVEETKHLVSDTIEQTMVIIETEGGDEERINIGNLVGETEFRVGVVGAEDEDDQGADDESGEGEIVTDGGAESPITDADIEAAIQSHDDPGHPDALTVGDVRALLDALQRDVEQTWGEWMDLVERDVAQVIADTGDAVVLATGERKLYDEILGADRTERPVAYDAITADVVNAAIHNAAERLTDRNWGYSYPMVITKPDGARGGEGYVTAIIHNLMRRGLSPGQAWAYYGVEIRGYSRNAWASRCGYADHSAVAEPLRKAERKLDV